MSIHDSIASCIILLEADLVVLLVGGGVVVLVLGDVVGPPGCGRLRVG
jgi:hypothetical protein